MADKGKNSWGEGELYEALCLLMTGTCAWIIGAQFGVFEAIGRLLLGYQFTNLFMLGFFMGLALLVANTRKSLKLRKAIRERDVATAEAELVARHDMLTGLANRRLFLEELERARGRATHEPCSAVLLIDLDRFKPVNDIYGHAAGNAVLCAVADRLRLLLPEGGIAARLGGDEFALMADVGGVGEHVTRLAQQVIAALAAPITWDQNELKIGATVGIAFLTQDHQDADAVLHAADLAMYQGKKDGRGTFRVFMSTMDVELKARAQVEQQLRQAIDSGEIEPFYQPVVTLPERDLTGIEVLARWRHPTRGLLSPAHFIAIAEETGLIADLSYSLLRRACIDAREWPAHLTMAVNISPQQFQDRWLSEHILAILTETGFPPHRLEIEITESALIQDLEATRHTLTSLQNVGVRIALDDFGTGYSSLYHLRELKFDKLKIDRTYVDAISMSDERAKLVDAIIKLGTSLGLVTTAEGIETNESLEWLAGQGCNFGQGFLFGEPMTKGDMDELLLAQVAATGPKPRAAAA